MQENGERQVSTEDVVGENSTTDSTVAATDKIHALLHGADLPFADQSFLSVNIEDYDGPLDLLDRLLAKNKVPVDRISIASITDQYLAIIRHKKQYDMALASDFLVMAATLIRLKSELLLPRDEDVAWEIDDVGDELVFRLLRYRRCRLVASHLQERYALYANCAVKPPESAQRLGITVESVLPVLEMAKFMAAAVRVSERNEARFRSVVRDIEHILEREEASVKQQIKHLLTAFKRKLRYFFYELFPASMPKTERVSGFLAVLELIRQDEVIVEQEGLFAPIMLERKLKPGMGK